jgi:heme/copper-type cytochrome/quinol oxidase subunit 2
MQHTMFSNSKPPQDILAGILLKYEYPAYDKFELICAEYGSMSDPTMQQYIEKQTKEQFEARHQQYAAALEHANEFLKTKDLSVAEKDVVDLALGDIKHEMEVKKSINTPNPSSHSLK